MLQIRAFTEADYPQIQAIYQQGIDFGFATCETEYTTWQEWDASMLPVCRFIAEKDNHIVGWAALSPISTQKIYAGVAEVGIYITQAARGMGIGHELMQHLVRGSELEGFWTLQAVLFPEHQPSVALMRRNGFHALGIRKHLAQVNGEWRDVVFMERRSKVVGV